MSTILPLGGESDIKEPFPWSADDRKFVSGVWQKFGKFFTLRASTLDILNGGTLQDYWNQSVKDYAVITGEIRDPNDPVVQYQSTISRDKSDVFIANLAGQLLYSDVVAQNADQEIDKVVSQVGSSLLEWAYKNDGWPTESGEQKNARYIHKLVVEGTVHCIDVVTKEGLESELIPNEELYIGNFWQPNIQKQPLLIRAKVNVLYEEAEQMFGAMDRWKYVTKGAWVSNWFNEAPFLKDGFEGIEWADRVQILYVWKQATPKELKELKAAGKVPKSQKRACFYNVIVNDVPMFECDNLSPFKHGYYPISKGKFQEFAKPEFYYGNSAPAKIREDKRWIDAWKTLLRYKGKLGVLKPQLVIGGSLDEEIMLPSKFTSIEAGVEVVPVPGVADGISPADFDLLQMAEGEIDRGTVSPQAAGQQGKSETARATVVAAAASERLLDSISQQVAYFQASRSFPILLSLFQFMVKRDIKKIAIPDQTLNDGIRGNLEIIFEAPGEMTQEEMMQKSLDILQGEMKSRKAGNPKDTVYIDPSYLKELNYFVTADASSILQDKSLSKIQKFAQDFPLLIQLPEIDRQELVKEYVRQNDYPSRILSNTAMQQPAPSPQGAPGQSQSQVQGQTERNTPADAQVSDISKAVTGAPLPSLPAVA